jgi:hypothetical protein
MANWMFGFFIDCVLEYGSEMISENEAFALANQQDWHRYLTKSDIKKMAHECVEQVKIWEELYG